MPLSQDVEEMIFNRAFGQPEYRYALLAGAAECLLGGEIWVGKASLRHCIEGGIGYNRLSELTGKTVDDLKDMLDGDSNPQASGLFQIISHIQREEGIRLDVKNVQLEVKDAKSSKRRRKASYARHKLRIARSYGLDNNTPPTGDERSGAGAAG